jgi:hypothetical protein
VTLAARLACALVCLLGALSAGCARRPPNALLICHNANCATPGTADADDEMGALVSSLALEVDGRPALDGVELDSVWDRASSRCLFAHGAGGGAPDFSEATKLVVDYLARTGDVSWNRERFYVKIELKQEVDGNGDAHSPAEAASHADCVLDQLAVLEAAARAGDRALTMIFDSGEASLLLAITQRPRWPGKRAGEQIEVKLEVGYDSSVPSGLEPDVLTIRWGAIDDGVRTELAARGKNVLAWGRDPSAATLEDLAYLEPTFIGANDAALVRRWLARAEGD